jgi:hypothetical protein
MPQNKEKTRKTGATARKNVETETQKPSTDSKYAPTAWGGELLADLPLPSGQLCQARRVGVEGLMKAGIAHQIDPLMKLVQGHEDRVKKGMTQEEKDKLEEQSILKMMSNDEQMESLFHLLNRVLCHVVVQPPVQMAPDDITRRVDGVIYTDMVDLEDKLYIMSWTVGGADAVAQFRTQLAGDVGSVSAQSADEDSTE